MKKGLTEEEVYKLMDDYSLIDASCLIAGVSPSQAFADDQYDTWYLRANSTDPDNANEAFQIALKSLSNSIKQNKLNAFVVILVNNTYLTTQNLNEKNWLLIRELDPEKTTINKKDLVEWLKNRGVFPSIFFPEGKILDISNTEHKFYCPKLHLIIDAWESLFTADIQSTTIKKHLEHYMSANKTKYRGLAETKESSISNLAEIANFDKGGSTIVGNPLHHFGIENKHQDSEIEKQSINPKIYANFTDDKDAIYDSDLPF